MEENELERVMRTCDGGMGTGRKKGAMRADGRRGRPFFSFFYTASCVVRDERPRGHRGGVRCSDDGEPRGGGNGGAGRRGDEAIEESGQWLQKLLENALGKGPRKEPLQSPRLGGERQSSRARRGRRGAAESPRPASSAVAGDARRWDVTGESWRERDTRGERKARPAAGRRAGPSETHMDARAGRRRQKAGRRGANKSNGREARGRDEKEKQRGERGRDEEEQRGERKRVGRAKEGKGGERGCGGQERRGERGCGGQGERGERASGSGMRGKRENGKGLRVRRGVRTRRPPGRARRRESRRGRAGTR